MVDIASRSIDTASVKNDAAGHNWVLVSKVGGKKFRIHRIDGKKSAEVYDERRVLKYKCKNCGITATEYPAEHKGIIPDFYKNLTCDELIIKDIIE